MNKNWIFATICTAFALLAFTTNTNAQVVVFSNDFEDGNLDAEVGSMTLVQTSAVTSVVPVTGGTDTTLGNNVGLFDRDTIPLDLTWNLTDPVSLADGNTVTLEFDVATRRTDGISKTVFVDAIDSNGNIVVRLVLGDSNIFGNGGNDRQRPGFATSADGNMIFGAPPGSFSWGSDSTPTSTNPDNDGFDPIRDARISLTFSGSSFDFSIRRAAGDELTFTGVSNYDTVASANIVEFKLTSFVPANGVVNWGLYFDNISVSGVVTDVVGVLKGDVDLNGEVNFLDISPFISVLSDGLNQAEADCDCDGDVDFLDIQPFINILAGN